MIRRYYIPLLLLVSFSSLLTAGRGSHDRLYKAIEESNIESATRLVKRLNPLSASEKEKLEEAAEDAIEEQEEKVGLLKSWWDLSKIVVGAPLSLLGLAFIGGGIASYIDTLKRPDNFSRKSEYLIMSAVASTVGTLATFLGGYLTLKGIRCSTAVARCQKAEAIEALIKSLKVSPAEQGSDSVSQS